jgi:hypothetical protein
LEQDGWGRLSGYHGASDRWISNDGAILGNDGVKQIQMTYEPIQFYQSAACNENDVNATPADRRHRIAHGWVQHIVHCNRTVVVKGQHIESDQARLVFTRTRRLTHFSFCFYSSLDHPASHPFRFLPSSSISLQPLIS